MSVREYGRSVIEKEEEKTHIIPDSREFTVCCLILSSLLVGCTNKYQITWTY